MVKMDESSAIKRKCDHPGVVGENDSWKIDKMKKKYSFISSNRHLCKQGSTERQLMACENWPQSDI